MTITHTQGIDVTQTIDTACEHIKLRLIAAAVGLQQCTQTDGTEVLIPGTDKRILIGSDAYLAQVAARATQPREQASELIWQARDILADLANSHGAFNDAAMVWMEKTESFPRQAAPEAPASEQQPIAWMCRTGHGTGWRETVPPDDIAWAWTALYATPAATTASTPLIVTGMLGSSNSTEPVRMFREATTASVSELEKCGVCGNGQLYCNECGTGFASIRRAALTQQSAAQAPSRPPFDFDEWFNEHSEGAQIRSGKDLRDFERAINEWASGADTERMVAALAAAFAPESCVAITEKQAQNRAVAAVRAAMSAATEQKEKP